MTELTPERIAELWAWAANDWCEYDPATPDELLALLDMAQRCQAAEAKLQRRLHERKN